MSILDNIKLDLTNNGIINKIDWNNRQVTFYKARITFNNKSFTINFYQGLGIKINPCVKDIIKSLLLDGNYADYNLNDFMQDTGYNIDSIKESKNAKSILKQCKKTQTNLNKLFTSEQLQELTELLQDY